MKKQLFFWGSLCLCIIVVATSVYGSGPGPAKDTVLVTFKNDATRAHVPAGQVMTVTITYNGSTLFTKDLAYRQHDESVSLPTHNGGDHPWRKKLRLIVQYRTTGGSLIKEYYKEQQIEFGSFAAGQAFSLDAPWVGPPNYGRTKNVFSYLGPGNQTSGEGGRVELLFYLG